jgi:hypothetical protein
VVSIVPIKISPEPLNILDHRFREIVIGTQGQDKISDFLKRDHPKVTKN